MATAIRRGPRHYRQERDARWQAISGDRRNAAAIQLPDPVFESAGTLDHDVEFATNSERWLATDDRAARQRFLSMRRATETKRLNSTGAGQRRHYRSELASTVSRETPHRRESHPGNRIDD